MDLFYFRQFVTAFVTLKCTMTQWFHWPYEILSRISRLKSEKYSNVSRKKYDQNLLHGKNIWLGLATLPPFYLRPIPSWSHGFRLNEKLVLMPIIILCEFGVLDYAVIISNPEYEWLTTPKMYFSLAQHLSLGRRTAPHCSGSSGILELHQLEYVFLDLLFCALFLNGHISLLPPVHWLQLVNGKGVGRYWVIGRVRVFAINHFELCRLGVLSYFLILSTVHTKCMLIPQKLN